MRRLNRFMQLSGAERHLLIQAGFVVGVTRAALWVWSADTVRRVAAKVARGAVGSLEQVVWAVETASRYLPGTTCLTQALAGQALLARSGFPARVEIGVAKDDLRRLQAHAWVVCYDQVVLGGQPANHYNSLISWEPQQ